ncbi:hypothetical protein DMN91_005707 [Ooceraea biroi]|uniref:Mos1 transposase HTH domain-containing protein n=1 Tax=Ooceraea biroi TaxID=2015173 RepID=A0A3L8DLN1_OOCBI|nr:hypothetical protein DMN91_005707 [Ooceraea biroi]
MTKPIVDGSLMLVSETARNINAVFGEGSTTKATVGNWFKNLRDGDFSLANEPRGRPKTKVDNDHLRAVVESDPSQRSQQELQSSFEPGIVKSKKSSKETCQATPKNEVRTNLRDPSEEDGEGKIERQGAATYRSLLPGRSHAGKCNFGTWLHRTNLESKFRLRVRRGGIRIWVPDLEEVSANKPEKHSENKRRSSLKGPVDDFHYDFSGNADTGTGARTFGVNENKL